MIDNLKLYTFKLCPFAHRVRIALAEKGLTAESIEVDLKNKPAEFITLSPYGRVPLLDHGGTRLWESAVILAYLDEAFLHPALMPELPAMRAQARLWTDFADQRLLAPTHRMVIDQNTAQKTLLMTQMQRDLESFERELRRQRATGPYVMGRQFTLADIALYPWFEQLQTLQKLSGFRMPGDCVAIHDWVSTVAARPAVIQCAKSNDWYELNYKQYLAA